MTKDDKNTNHHVTSTWEHFNVMTATASHLPHGGDLEYVRLFEAFFPAFSGKILEIGAGTGFLAQKILEITDNVDYTILDIERNMPIIKKTLANFPDVQYVPSSEYEKVFENNWDLVIDTHALSETPDYYYTSIFENISTNACFVIDYRGDLEKAGRPSTAWEDPLPAPEHGTSENHFEIALNLWVSTFDELQSFRNYDLVGGKPKGIPVYIGKSTTGNNENS